MKAKLLGMGVGSAVGDALGAAVEFKTPGTFPPVTGYRGGGPHPIGPGDWTDDTSMSLALAASLRQGFHRLDQAERYLRWYRKGDYSVNGRCFDIGCQTRTALAKFQQGEVIWSSSEYEDSCGNGSLMRLAPIVVKYHAESPWAVADWARLQSTVTHPALLCQEACAYLAQVLQELALGKSKEEALRDRPSFVTLPGALKAVAQGNYKEDYFRPRATGYVVDTLAAALACFWHTDCFADCVLAAVNLGEDADTVGAVAGMLAGAYYGLEGIPQQWKQELTHYGQVVGAYAQLLPEGE